MYAYESNEVYFARLRVRLCVRDVRYTGTVKLPVSYFKRYDIIILHNSVFHTLLFRSSPVGGSASQIAARPVNVTTEQVNNTWIKQIKLLTRPKQTCINFFLVLNTKDDILKNVGTKQLLVHIEFDRRENMKSPRISNCLVFLVPQNSIFFQQKKETHLGLINTFFAWCVLNDSFSLKKNPIPKIRNISHC